MESEKMLEIANQVMDEMIEEIDSHYENMEKRQGFYEITGEYHNIWLRRISVLFEADGYDVVRVDSEKILVRGKR